MQCAFLQHTKNTIAFWWFVESIQDLKVNFTNPRIPEPNNLTHATAGVASTTSLVAYHHAQAGTTTMAETEQIMMGSVPQDEIRKEESKGSTSNFEIV